MERSSAHASSASTSRSSGDLFRIVSIQEAPVTLLVLRDSRLDSGDGSLRPSEVVRFNLKTLPV